MKKLLPAVLATLLLITGCSAVGVGASDAGMPPADVDLSAESDGAQAVGGSEAAGDQSGTAPLEVGPKEYLVREAQLGIKVDDVMAAAAQVREIASAVGGSVTNESFGDGYYGDMGGIEQYGSLTVSVPSDTLDATLSRISEVGEVQSRSTNAYSVQNEYVDVEARIATLSASIGRMRDLIEQTDDIDQIVRLESALSARQADLDSLQARLNALSGSIAMSPVDVRLTTTGDLGASQTGISVAFKDAWNGFTTSAAALIRTVGVLLPWVVVGGLGLWLLVWLINRIGSRSARAARTPDLSEQRATPPPAAEPKD